MPRLAQPFRTEPGGDRLRLSRFPRPRLLLSFLTAAALAPHSGLAGTVSVTQNAAFAGAYGLDIDVAWACSSPDDLVVPPQTITSSLEFEACNSVTVDAVEIEQSGDATFRAGSSITLKEGFSVGPNASAVVTIDPALSPHAYLRDDSPAAETGYNARFYLRLDSLVLGPNDEFTVFVASAVDGTQQLRVFLRDILGGANGLGIAALENGGLFAETPPGSEIVVSDGWHALEIEWKQAESGQMNGHLHVWLDGQPLDGLENLDNDLGQIDAAMLGVVEGMDLTTAGILHFDEFVSSRHGYIGLLE